MTVESQSIDNTVSRKWNINNEEAEGLENPGHSLTFCSEILGAALNKTMTNLNYPKVYKIQKIWPYLEKQV